MTDSGVGSCHLNLPDNQTLDYLLRTYGQRLVCFAYSITTSAAAAEDAMEDAFAALLVKGGKFRTEEQIRAWLYKTTRNRAVDYLRRHKRDVPLLDVEEVLHGGDLEGSAALNERDETLYRCMQSLPPLYRQVLELCYLEGFDIPQVCRILGKSRKQVYNLLARAKVTLKEKLIQEGISHEDI